MLEQDTQIRQQEFRKELGLRDLVLCQILNIVGLTWVGVAAKLGPQNVAFWLMGIVLFYLPSAAVVIYLNRAHTIEGGLYEWARLGFSEFTGFLVGWNLWLNPVVLIAFGGIQATSMVAYLLGPDAAWIAESKWMIAVVTAVIMAALVAIAWAGLRVGKWVQDVGAVVLVVVFVALIALPFRNHLPGRATGYPPFTLALPAISLLSLNILGKIGFSALSGFDSMAIFAGECRDASRTIGWSVMIAAPIIALMFVLGTSSMVALVPADRLDLVNPIPQALAMGTQAGDPGASLIPLVMGALIVAFFGNQVLLFACTTRLPLVAGWDKLLPDWFGRLHAVHKTPTNSIFFVGAMAFALAIAGVTGAGQQEGFQILQSVGGMFYAIAYLALFALPLVGKQRRVSKPPLWLQAASVSGFLMTALFLVLAVFPIIDVPHPLVFTAKVGGFIVACQLAAAALFYSYRKRSGAIRL